MLRWNRTISTVSINFTAEILPHTREQDWVGGLFLAFKLVLVKRSVDGIWDRKAAATAYLSK